MSDVNVSFRHLKKLSDLPPKLTRGRIYFVDDVEYYVIDHGAGPVYYGKKDAERLGLLEGRATELEKRATAVEGRATDLEKRATNVEKRATDLEGRATKVEGRMTTAEGDIDAVENRATSLEGRAKTLETRADGHDTADKALQDRATSLEGRMTTAEGDIDTLESRADGHDAADKALQGRAKTLEDDLNTANTGLKARMTKAEGNISTNAGNISTNASDIDKLETRATNLESRATSLETTTTQHTTDITNLTNNKADKITPLSKTKFYKTINNIKENTTSRIFTINTVSDGQKYTCAFKVRVIVHNYNNLLPLMFYTEKMFMLKNTSVYNPVVTELYGYNNYLKLNDKDVQITLPNNGTSVTASMVIEIEEISLSYDNRLHYTINSDLFTEC